MFVHCIHCKMVICNNCHNKGNKGHPDDAEIHDPEAQHEKKLESQMQFEQDQEQTMENNIIPFPQQ